MDPAGGDLDYKQHVQAFEEHRVHGEEVHRQHTFGLRSEELPPRDGRPLRRWVNTGELQDGPDGAGPYPVAEPAQLTVDAAVAPGRVLPGQPQHQSADLQRHAWTTTPVWVGPAAPDQVAVPSQQRGRLHQPSLPHPAWQQPRQPSQHRPVSPVQLGSGHPPAQHRNLVAQQQELGILGCRTSRQQRKPPHHLAEHQVHQSQGHLPIIATR